MCETCERIIEVMDGKKFKKEKFGKKHIDKIKGDFSFEHVCFSYDDMQQNICAPLPEWFRNI